MSRFVPSQSTNSQSSSFVSCLNLLIPIPEYAAASSNVRLLFSQIGTSFIKVLLFFKYNKTPNRRTISCAHLRPRIFRLRYAHFIYGRAPQGYYRTLSAKPVSPPAAIQVFKVQRESKLYLAFSPINTETFLKILHFKIKKHLALSADYPGNPKKARRFASVQRKRNPILKTQFLHLNPHGKTQHRRREFSSVKQYTKPVGNCKSRKIAAGGANV